MKNFSNRNNSREVNGIYYASKITYMYVCRIGPKTFTINCKVLYFLLLAGFEFLARKADLAPLEPQQLK